MGRRRGHCDCFLNTSGIPAPTVKHLNWSLLIEEKREISWFSDFEGQQKSRNAVFIYFFLGKKLLRQNWRPQEAYSMFKKIGTPFGGKKKRLRQNWRPQQAYSMFKKSRCAFWGGKKCLRQNWRPKIAYSRFKKSRVTFLEENSACGRTGGH